MRPFTLTNCWTLSSETPMGCCCSNSKIRPESEKKRPTLSLARQNVFAPTKLAISSLKSDISLSMRENKLRRETEKESVQQQESSGEEFILEFSEDIRNYNRELAQKNKLRRGPAGHKVPKTRGFNFLSYPNPPTSQPSQSQRNTYSRASSAVAVATLAARTLNKSRNFPPTGPTTDNDSCKKLENQNPEGFPKELESGVEGGVGADTDPVTNDRLLYKRIDKKEVNNEQSDHNSDYTAVTTSGDEANENEREVSRQVIAVKIRDKGTQYYEQIYTKNASKSKHSGISKKSKSIRPVSATSRKSQILEEIDDNNIRRLHKLAEKMKAAAGTKNGRAAQQRLLDAYLAQPKVLIVPIVRDRKKSSSTINKGQRRKSRRILKKPWRIPSKKNLPMIRESGIGSSNIRFAPTVKVRSIGFDRHSGSRSSSSLQTNNSSLDNVRVRSKLKSDVVKLKNKDNGKDKDRDSETNFLIKRYFDKAGVTKLQSNK